MLSNEALVVLMDLYDRDLEELRRLKCTCSDAWDRGSRCDYHSRSAQLGRAHEALKVLELIHSEVRPRLPYDLEIMARQLSRLGQLERDSTPGVWALHSESPDSTPLDPPVLVSLVNNTPLLEVDPWAHFGSLQDAHYVVETRRHLPVLLRSIMRLLVEVYDARGIKDRQRLAEPVAPVAAWEGEL